MSSLSSPILIWTLKSKAKTNTILKSKAKTNTILE